MGSGVPAWLIKHPRYTYVRQAILSQPDWVDKAALKRIHEYKRLLSVCTGVEHVADHIVPLNHPDVCGLTVPWNLKVMTRKQNAAKSNKWNPHQMEPSSNGTLIKWNPHQMEPSSNGTLIKWNPHQMEPSSNGTVMTLDEFEALLKEIRKLPYVDGCSEVRVLQHRIASISVGAPMTGLDGVGVTHMSIPFAITIFPVID